MGVGFLGLALFDALSLLSVGSTTFFSRRGLWQLHGPAGWMCAGAMAAIGLVLILFALWLHRRDARAPKPVAVAGPPDAQADPFEDALGALRDILERENLPFWRDWIEQDLREWRQHRRTDHHRSAYGGMGSLNDLMMLEPWREALFDNVKALCAAYAQQPPRIPEAHRVEQALPPINYPLLGWRCLVCGHAALSEADRESWLAKTIVRREAAVAALQGKIRQWSGRIMDEIPSQAETERKALLESLEQSGIGQMGEDHWKRPCPACGSDQSALYRWIRSGDGTRWEPGKDNLPISAKGARS